MNSIKKNIRILFLLMSIVYTGCKAPQTILDSDKKQIPQAFAETNDSTNSADIIWKDFFADKNLIALIDTALKNNFDVLITLQRIEQARSGIQNSKSAMLPVVNGNVSYLQRKFGYYTMDDAGNRTTEITPGKIIPTNLPDFYAGLQTSWEIDVWGKLRNKKKAALARYLASVEGKNLVVTNLVTEIANTYYELLALDNQIEIVRENIKLQQDALDVIKVQKDAATATELAVQQFEAQVYNSQAMEIEILQQIAELENKLNFLLGRFPQSINRNKAQFNLPLAFMVQTGLPVHLLNYRPDIKQAEYELLASKADLKAAKAAFYPTLSVNGSVGFQAFKPQFLFDSPKSIAYSLLGSLVQPLINRGAIKAEFRYANAVQLEALYNYQKTILNAYLEVNNQVSNTRNLLQMYELKTKEVDVLTRSIETSNDLFKTGRANYLEVLISRQGALQSRLQLIDTKKRQYHAIVNIYKALGGGWR
jgi:multidrug efflux system outer membrane protein